MSAVAPPLPDNLGDRLDDATAEELRNMETVMDQSEALVDELPGCQWLERRWILWHGFMTQHAHLDAWLRLAEQVVASQCVPVIYTSAREDLSRFERLRCEAASQLVQLDGLTQRNRTLTRLFHGAMRARLLRMVRECGERWDSVNAKLESVAARLKLFVSEWEEFEAEREELDLWLTDLDTRLTEVNHLTGNTCDKLRLLQSFQQGVCMNLGRVNELLRRGETLIQRSKVADMHHVESNLVELLRRCSHVHNNIAQTHTRLLSMRLVFEDDWILSHATDSGCPSESLLEDEGALDKLHLPTSSVLHEDSPSSLHFPPSPPSSPSHEQLGLEWDPSVDIGPLDSSYFSVSTDGLKRRSFLTSFDSLASDITNKQEVKAGRDGLSARPPAVSPVPSEGMDCRLSHDQDQWATSTPQRGDSEPGGFNDGWVRAWLGVQSSSDGHTSCCTAVQTDAQEELDLDAQRVEESRQTCCCCRAPSSHDLNSSSDWTKNSNLSDSQAQQQQQQQQQQQKVGCEQKRFLLDKQRSRAPWSPCSLALLCLLLAAALLAALVWAVLEPPCHRSNRMPHSFHLRYVGGPPPT